MNEYYEEIEEYLDEREDRFNGGKYGVVNPVFKHWNPGDDLKPSLLNLRRELVLKYSWAIPTTELVESFASFSPILSVGAGSGYLEYLLFQRGANVVATDACLGEDNTYGYKAEDTWLKVEILDGARAVRRYPDRTLLLSWPPFADSMASETLQAYEGDVLLYIGEGWGGCTGDDAFHEALDAEWDLEEILQLPRWYGIRDSACIYYRKTS